MRREMMKFFPVYEYDLAAVENWFHKMAAEGLFVKETAGCWCYFEKRDPERTIYHLELAGEEEQPSEEEKALYAAQGWHYVTTHKRIYHIFRAEEGTGALSDWEEKKNGALLKRKKQDLGFLILLTVSVLICDSFSARNLYQAFLIHPAQTLTEPEFSLAVITTLFLVCIFAEQFQNYRLLKNGRGESKQFRPYLRYGKLLIGILFVAALLRSCGRGSVVEQNLDDEKCFLSLQALEDGELQTLEVEEEKGTGTVIYESGFLVKEHYSVSQTGRVIKAKEDGNYIASLDAEYYNLYSERLAGAILDEWIQDAISDGVEAFTAPDYFNFCYLAETDEQIAGLPVQKLYARWEAEFFR